jgi:hypothetical protein
MLLKRTMAPDMNDVDQTVEAALKAFWKKHDIDESCESAKSWVCKLGFISFRLPNFEWRKKAIARHDLHHIITGYPCNIRGECQVATWEYAAGKFPHLGANLFCLPLVCVGFAWSPKKIWRAFIAGRNTQSLYHHELTPDILQSPLSTLRPRVKNYQPQYTDVIAFAKLLLVSFLLSAAPIAAVIYWAAGF